MFSITTFYELILNPKNIEKEIFIRLTPCYNCFRYNHRTRDCPLDQQILCSYCSQEGHKHNQCTSQEPKCINCGGRHRTLTAVCKVRRDIIKEKGKEIRTKSRSRSANRQTYAGITTATQRSNIDTIINHLSRDEAKTIITKIMASIAYAHYIETIQPGSFQNTVDEMFVLDKLPKVKFPTNIVTQGIRDLFSNTMQTNLDSQSQGATQRETSNERESELFAGSETMEIESHKRLRESSELSAPEMIEKREKKKKETDKTENTQTDKTDTEQKDVSTKPREYKLPPPTQPRSRPPSPGPGATQSTKRKTEKPKVQTKSSNIKIKDVGIMIYLKKSSRYIIDIKDPERREILRDAILRGESKIQWRHKDVTYEAIYNGINTRFIGLEEVTITKLPDNDFNKVRNKCINL